MHLAIRLRFVTIGLAVLLLVASLSSFGSVSKLFFPDAAMTKFMIDYWMPEGTRIERVASDMADIEQKLLEDERVKDVASFVGAGPPRFYLPVEPEPANPAYGQLVVNVHDFREIDALIADIDRIGARDEPADLILLSLAERTNVAGARRLLGSHQSSKPI